MANKTRLCRKCGNYIPYVMQINGKHVNLQNRKFCLKCSPYNGHNNKPDDPARPSKSREKRYSSYSKQEKRRQMILTYWRGLNRKKELIALAGGKCKKCGYDKCIDALLFHHRNSSKKLFGLALNNLWSKNMNIIMTEFKKCDLLCSNCHIELHRQQVDTDPDTYRNIIPTPNRIVDICKR